MSGGIAGGRLAAERKNWRANRPFGFVAKPATLADGSTDLMRWECAVPGKENTDWHGGLYHLRLTFSSDYPSKPPDCRFVPPLFHPNVYPDGKICLNIIQEAPYGAWRANLTIHQILLGIQELLHTPNNKSPAQEGAYVLLSSDPKMYREKVLEQAKKFAPKD